MLYISKGALRDGTIAWRGKEFQLEGEQLQLWRQGHCDATLASASQLETLLHLGLVEITESDDPASLYRLLTRCVICPISPCWLRLPLRRTERQLWRWVTCAGLHLSLAELTCLLEEGVRPVPELLGAENRQALVETIYTTETIADGLLEARMEEAWGRDAVVAAVLGLLRKRRIYLL